MAHRSRSHSLEEKRRRRAKRLEKWRRAEETVDEVIGELEAVAKVPDPSHWPGACDQSVVRPDLVKLDLGMFASEEEPWKSNLGLLKTCFRKGPLGFLPDIDHWAMEEFFWHGFPGHDSSPVEAFLARERERFPAAAREQLRRWKEARVGAFEVGESDGATICFRPWDVPAKTPSGGFFRAIALNIGGVNAYVRLKGRITITYVSPWVPAEGLFCAMGFGLTVHRHEAWKLLPYTALRQSAAAARPFPWEESTDAKSVYLSQWKARDWRAWFAERLEFPFKAIVPLRTPTLLTVTGLLETTPEQAREFGVYFESPRGGETLLVGGTAVSPIDLTSPCARALAEYRAYRERVGPPRGLPGGLAAFS